MNLTENQKIWLDALRSGKYKQGYNGALHEKCDGADEFCCLGVAAKIFAHGDVAIQVNDFGVVKYNGQFATAPDYVMEALGLFDACGRPKSESQFISLSLMNDNGRTFVEIADHFEANVKAYTNEK